jgi:hypothetical protein
MAGMLIRLPILIACCKTFSVEISAIGTVAQGHLNNARARLKGALSYLQQIRFIFPRRAWHDCAMSSAINRQDSLCRAAMLSCRSLGCFWTGFGLCEIAEIYKQILILQTFQW